MATGERADGVQPGRLDKAQLAENFQDLHAPYDDHEAMVAADRCYFCYDAPCVTACPTSIDIPLFIRQIQAGQPDGAAKTIFDQNILGGMCARVCPALSATTARPSSACRASASTSMGSSSTHGGHHVAQKLSATSWPS